MPLGARFFAIAGFQPSFRIATFNSGFVSVFQPTLPLSAPVVALVLDSPVVRPDSHIQSAPYRVTFGLDDGSTIECWYLPASGEVTRGDVSRIEVPAAFHDALASAVGAPLPY